jgi:hypothetical protein
VDSAGNLFIADTFNSRIRKVTPAGIISTVAGSGDPLDSGDGVLAIKAGIGPDGIAVDAAGDLFITESSGQRVREVLSMPPSVSLTPTQLQFSAASGGSPTQPQTLSLTSPVEGLPFSITLPDGLNWLQVNPSSGTSPRLIQVVADPTNLAPNSNCACPLG